MGTEAVELETVVDRRDGAVEREKCLVGGGEEEKKKPRTSLCFSSVKIDCSGII